MDGVKTACRVLILPRLRELAGARSHFIAEKQQYHNENSRLDGAHLIYDNEEGRYYYDQAYGHYRSTRDF